MYGQGNWRRTHLERVGNRVVFSARPSFVPPPKKGCGPSLGFYLVDGRGEEYVLYLRDIYEHEQKMTDEMFKIEITGMGGIDNNGRRIVFATKWFNVNDQIVVLAESVHRRDQTRLVGHESRHLVFMPKQDPKTREKAEVGDVIIGRIKKIDHEKRVIDLTVLQVIHPDGS